MLDVVGQATGLYRGDRAGFDTVRRRGMTADLSQARSTGAYRPLSENLMGRRPAANPADYSLCRIPYKP